VTVDPGGVSVVIPALDEAGRIGDCIRSAREAGAGEVIVVDGGSADGTPDAAQAADRVLSSARGRAAQMNAGAAAATGDFICFLHADTRLPAGGCEAVRAAFRDAGVAGGAFSAALAPSPDAGRWARGVLGLVQAMIGVRARLFRTYTGDQAIFIRRSLFERIGGYERVALMEDVQLSAAMRRAGKTVLLPERATTSARRWESRGPLRTVLLMWFLRAAHAAGMSPETCARLYR
jgi:rSAM/selenodomain-associated transferase 2